MLIISTYLNKCANVQKKVSIGKYLHILLKLWYSQRIPKISLKRLNTVNENDFLVVLNLRNPISVFGHLSNVLRNT